MLRHCWTQAKNSSRPKPPPFPPNSRQLLRFPPPLCTTLYSHSSLLTRMSMVTTLGIYNTLHRAGGDRVVLSTIFQSIRGTSFQYLNIMNFITTQFLFTVRYCTGMNVVKESVLCEVRTKPSSRYGLVFKRLPKFAAMTNHSTLTAFSLNILREIWGKHINWNIFWCVLDEILQN